MNATPVMKGCSMRTVMKKQSGFTLIESLLTLFILAVGLLGVAGLQMQSLRSGSVAMQRMIVTVKAQEMMERVRANMVKKAGKGDTTADEREKVLDFKRQTIDLYANTSGVNSACINGTVCNTAEMVAFDIFQWERELESLLPGAPTSVITVNDLSMTINITWTDRGDTYSYSVTSQI